MSGETQNGKMSADPREVISDFMLQGHLHYAAVGRASDYDRTDAMIRDLAEEGVAIVSTAHIAAIQREAEEMREALKAIAEGRVDLKFDEKTDRPLWHVAFVQLQSIARSALSQARGEPSLSSEGK